MQFFSLVKTQFGAKIKQLRSENAKELAISDFYNKGGLYTNLLVLPDLSKTLLLKGSTNICSMLLVHYFFSLKFLYLSGVIVFLWQPF